MTSANSPQRATSQTQARRGLRCCAMRRHGGDPIACDYTAAINIDNSLTWAYNNRAYAYRLRGQSGDRDRAIADFRRALTIEPNFENSVRGLREMGVKP